MQTAKVAKPKTYPLFHISVMSGKLEGLHAISTNTKTNPYCIKQNQSADEENICTKCYSHTMLDSYRKNMQPALQRNSDALSSVVYSESMLPKIMDLYFRFDAHGELINETHFINLINIARANPDTSFALWTKRTDIVNKVLGNDGGFYSGFTKPDNLILIYSNPKISRILAKPPKHFDRTFNNVLKHEHVEQQNCTGQKCMDCLLCYKPVSANGVDTIVEMVKKY
jgi:hypothetical protein